MDHFIPWSRYPRDTALNFVVAHGSCNGDKSDLLAAERHLVNWLGRNQREGAEISGLLQTVGFYGDADMSKRVAHWAYQQALQQGAMLWVRGKSFESVDQKIIEKFN